MSALQAVILMGEADDLDLVEDFGDDIFDSDPYFDDEVEDFLDDEYDRMYGEGDFDYDADEFEESYLSCHWND